MTSELVLPAVEEEPAAPAAPPPSARSADAALVVFAFVEVVAFVTFLVLGRHLWFWGDEWDFLAGRTLNAGDLFRPHGGHLVAIPVVAYRALYFVFGLRAYLPYQALIVLAHLGVAALLRVVMRRAGVGPWVATAAATLYVFFGAAGQDIIWAFQITFVGALFFGLVQLLLADHDGALDRRDWLGLAAGVAAILCSGVGITMVAVVGLATLARRGWRAALFHTVPLAAAYTAWWWHYDRGQFISHNRTVLYHWDRRGLAGTFGALTQVPFLGFALAAMLVAGLVLAYRQHDLHWLRTRAAAPLAMLLGAPLFLTLTGATRVWAGIDTVDASRYRDIVAALLLPALALAGSALVRQWRYFAPVVIALFLVGIPGNLPKTTDSFPNAQTFDAYEQIFRSLPRSPIATRVPGSARPDPHTAPDVTIAWLLEAARSGRLRPIGPLAPPVEARNVLRLSLQQSLGGDGPCERLLGPVRRRLDPGATLVVRGTVDVRLEQDDGVISNSVLFGDSFLAGQGLHTLRTIAGPLTLHIAPHIAALNVPVLYTPALCGA